MWNSTHLETETQQTSKETGIGCSTGNGRMLQNEGIKEDKDVGDITEQNDATVMCHVLGQNHCHWFQTLY
jgi:hypothetical protein